jgi:DNA invertase Pin-like site-specific DNA recombinase
MLERQRERRAKAKSDGKYKGRAPIARAKTELVLEMVRAGKTGEAVAADRPQAESAGSILTSYNNITAVSAMADDACSIFR